MALANDDLTEVLRHFPDVVSAFAYGSGVIEQGGYNYNKPSESLPMLDLIFVVENSVNWHSLNKLLNPDHYSSVFPMSAQLIANIQDSYGARIWFNAMVPMNTKNFPLRQMKYGVIQKDNLENDLLNWENLYIAGRLHKPVRWIKREGQTLNQCFTINHEHTVRTALLLLPKIFNEVDLYLSIASLSYIGDPRMLMGENPKKVVNLVTPIVPQYRSMYKDAFSKLGRTVDLKVVGMSHNQQLQPHPTAIYSQDVSPAARWTLCEGLPLVLRRILLLNNRRRFSYAMRRINREINPPKKTAIRAALSSVVAKAASAQSLKGLFTIGLFKSTIYIAQKVSKRFSGFNIFAA